MEDCRLKVETGELANSKQKPGTAVGITLSWPQLLAALALPALGFAAYLGSLTSDVKSLRHDVDQHTQRIDEIWKELPSLRALADSAHPTSTASQQAARKLIADATKRIIPPISVSDVGEAGKKFIEAAQTNPNAWDAALDFVTYRSGLNLPDPSPVATISQHPPADIYTTYYYLGPVPGLSEPTMKYRVGYFVPQDQAARAELLSHPFPQPTKNGIGSFMALGGAMSLDNMHLRHVVLQDVEIHYSGGPAFLEDVVFVNCRFVIENQPAGRQLAENILSSDRVTIDLA